MALDHTKRNYLTIDELEDYANITVTDDDEALDNIEQAEEIIDQYVGWQDRFIALDHRGEVSSISSKTVVDSGSGTQLDVTNGYYTGATLLIISGTGAGQMRRIASSNRSAKSITYEGDAITGLAAADAFIIRQPGKFPRIKDVFPSRDSLTLNKIIPEAVKRATAAQVEYIVNQGADFFATDEADKTSESIGNYSYTKGAGASTSSLIKMVAPKARTLLRGIMNRGGRIVAGPDSCL